MGTLYLETGVLSRREGTCPTQKEKPPVPHSGSGGLSHAPILVSDVGQQSDGAGALDSDLNLSLVLSASTGHTAGQDLAALADELAELVGILVVDKSDLVCAEDADLLSLAAHEGAGRTSGGILSHFRILQ